MHTISDAFLHAFYVHVTCLLLPSFSCSPLLPAATFFAYSCLSTWRTTPAMHAVFLVPLHVRRAIHDAYYTMLPQLRLCNFSFVFCFRRRDDAHYFIPPAPGPRRRFHLPATFLLDAFAPH